MKRRIAFALLIAPLFSVGLLAQAPVRTWVATTGLDTNACSRTSPCRNFAAAITAVAAGGEVVVLESGGYGAVTVTKAVAIISPPGIHAAVAPTGGDAVTVNGAATDVIVLRGLYLNSQGATGGVFFQAGKALHVENLVVAGFTNGVRMQTASDMFVKDTIVRDNSERGLWVISGLGIAFVSVDRARLDQNNIGVAVNNFGRVIVRDSVASSNVNGFFAAGVPGQVAELILESCMASNNDSDGVQVASDATAMVSNSIMTNNSFSGIRTTVAGALVRVAGSSISGNPAGLRIEPGSTVSSFGNNVLEGNTIDGTFTPPIIALQ